MNKEVLFKSKYWPIEVTETFSAFWYSSFDLLKEEEKYEKHKKVSFIKKLNLEKRKWK